MPRRHVDTVRLAAIFSTVCLGILASQTQSMAHQVSAAAVHFLEASQRAPRGQRHVFHGGPGIYDDYKPLMTRQGIQSLRRRNREQLERAFHKDFRLSSKAFRYIVKEIGSDFKTDGGKYSREFAALAALHHLATGCTYREVSSGSLFDACVLLSALTFMLC